ncbi:hypothetical protein E2320_014815 [Naja naja]|nr:hypothetical protein E2320_014815 [Naja naja]
MRFAPAACKAFVEKTERETVCVSPLLAWSTSVEQLERISTLSVFTRKLDEISYVANWFISGPTFLRPPRYQHSQLRAEAGQKSTREQLEGQFSFQRRENLSPSYWATVESESGVGGRRRIT